jgi:hypothetical protein
MEGKDRLLAGHASGERKARLGGHVDRPLEAERQALLHAGDDIMLAPELEGAIVIEEPIEPAVERARRPRPTGFSSASTKYWPLSK